MIVEAIKLSASGTIRLDRLSYCKTESDRQHICTHDPGSLDTPE
jgi:hypothetical protein